MDVNSFKEIIAKAVEQFAAGVTKQAEEAVKARIFDSFGVPSKPAKAKLNGKRRGRPPGSKNKATLAGAVAPPAYPPALTGAKEPVASHAEAVQIVKEQKRVKRGSNATRKCLDPDCDGQPVLAKGLCRKHYYAHRRMHAKEQAANGAEAPATATP